MSKQLFGNHYYSMENSFKTKAEAQREATKLRKSGKYLVRVAPTGLAKWGWTSVGSVYVCEEGQIKNKEILI